MAEIISKSIHYVETEFATTNILYDLGEAQLLTVKTDYTAQEIQGIFNISDKENTIQRVKMFNDMGIGYIKFPMPNILQPSESDKESYQIITSFNRGEQFMLPKTEGSYGLAYKEADIVNGIYGSGSGSALGWPIYMIDGVSYSFLPGRSTYGFLGTNFVINASTDKYPTSFFIVSNDDRVIIFWGQIGYSKPPLSIFIYDEANSKRFLDWLYNLPDVEETDDPYAPGGSTEPGGGGGDFDDSSDPIDFAELPRLSAVDTGFIQLYNPSVVELKQLANYLWGDLFDITTWKKIFADPMDAVLGLSIVPVAVPNGGLNEITIGNIPTGINMIRALEQYVNVDCGSVNVKEFWGAYLDYDPYTKAELYLPFIGTHPIAVDDIMTKTVHIMYHVDILSGACCAEVKCNDSVLYTFVGQCSCSIPITGNDWTNVINGALSIASAIGSMVATGGATAPAAAGTIASNAVNNLKPSIEKSGSVSGMGGILGGQKPYLILTRPRQATPTRQNTYTGYPSFMTTKLGDLTGYTEIYSIHLEGIPATDQELSEIEGLLHEGVIF